MFITFWVSGSTVSEIIFHFFFRLGFLIDFLSHAAVVGFMGGAAITIALQQLKGFLGIKKFTQKTSIVAVLQSVFSSAHHGVITHNSFFSSVSFFFTISSYVWYHCLQWNWQTILISISFLIFLLVCKFIVSLQTIHRCLSLIYVFLFWSDLFIQTGEEEQETVLDSGRSAVAISYYFNLLCLYNPSRQERC